VPRYGPIKRRDLIKGLRKLGWNGPYPGKPHPYMRKDGRRLTIPNVHTGDIGIGLLRQILEEAGISREEWAAV
jgi:predicted RNA binding protein YcfA (HicA-like mRNA interferase family)